MTPEMITAIGALVVGIGSIISAILLNRKTMALLQYRMEQVEKKLDTHNGYAQKFSESTEKIAEIQKAIAVIETEIKYIREK